MRFFAEPIEFEWDKGNIGKNEKHAISDSQAEEPFNDDNQRVFEDAVHSTQEKRYILFGKTKLGRLLVVAFTMRSRKVRIISVRDINRKEVLVYEKTTNITEIQK